MLIFLYIALLGKQLHKQKSIVQNVFVYFGHLMQLKMAPKLNKNKPVKLFCLLLR